MQISAIFSRRSHLTFMLKAKFHAASTTVSEHQPSGWAAAMNKPMLCIMKPYDGQGATVGNGVMAGITADSCDVVDRIYRKALELGGTDEGSPGYRPVGGDGFYAAYFHAH